MLTRELKKSSDNLAVHGKLIIYLSTNITGPIQNPGPTATGTSSAAVTGGAGSSTLGAAAPSTPVATGTTPIDSSFAASANEPVNATNAQTSQPASASSPSRHSATHPHGPSSPPAVNMNVANNTGAPLTNPTAQASTTGLTAASGTGSTPAASAGSNNFDPHSDQLGPLPAGWERRIDHLGRQYYVDHNTRTTTWNRPSDNQANNTASLATATGDARARHNQRTLADDMLDTNGGGSGGASTPTANGNAAGSSSAAPPAANVSGSTAPGAGVLPAGPVATQAGAGPLPSGWEQRFTPEGRPYFVDHNTRTTTWVDPRRQQLLRVISPNGGNLTVQPQTVSQLGPLPSGWEMRLTSTARVYFVDHNTKTTTWDDPRLPSSLDQNTPQYKRDFRRKLIYFRSQPALRPNTGQCHIKVSRENIFEGSYSEIMRQTPNDLKKRLMIKFEGEDGLDYGGLSREFFFLLSHEMFNPFYCLFEYSAHDNYTLQINPNSGVNPEHLNYFKFIGRVLGLGIFHRRFLDAYFIVSFYKMILHKKISLPDLESVDVELHRGLTWML